MKGHHPLAPNPRRAWRLRAAPRRFPPLASPSSTNVLRPPAFHPARLNAMLTAPHAIFQSWLAKPEPSGREAALHSRTRGSPPLFRSQVRSRKSKPMITKRPAKLGMKGREGGRSGKEKRRRTWEGQDHDASTSRQKFGLRSAGPWGRTQRPTRINPCYGSYCRLRSMRTSSSLA